MFKKTVLALAIAHSAATHADATFFGITSSNATTGTMALTDSSLGGNPASYITAGGNNIYQWAAVFFRPAETANYTFGMTSSPADNIMILYRGSFNPANPSIGAIIGNDDTSAGDHQQIVGNRPILCGPSTNYCPQVTSSLSAGQSYTLLVSTYSPLPRYTVELPLEFYASLPGAFSARAGLSFILGDTPLPSGTSALVSVIDSTPALQTLFTSLPVADIPRALEQSRPVTNGGSQEAVRGAMRGSSHAVRGRIAGFSGRNSGDTFLGDQTLWVKPFVSRADQDVRDGVAGYKADTYGIVFGTEGKLMPGLDVGIAATYAATNVNGDSTTAPQGSDVKVYQLIGYGRYALNDVTGINFQVDVGQGANKTRKDLTAFGVVADGKYNTYAAHAGVGIERIYTLSGSTTFTPEARFDYTYTRDSAYAETGAGLLNGVFPVRDEEIFSVGFNGNVTHKLNDQTSVFGELGVAYRTNNKPTAITSSFAGAPGVSFISYGVSPSPWTGLAALGLEYKTKTGFDLVTRYDAEYRETYLNQTVSANVRWKF